MICIMFIGQMSFRGQISFSTYTRRLINSLGSLNSLAFTSNVALVLGAYQCEEHPAGVTTMRKYQSVVCWHSDEHQAIAGVAGIFLVLPIGFLAICSWMIY